MPKRTSRLAAQSRREEIEQRLTACGLGRGPRRLFRNKNTVGFERPPSRRLRTALEGLGPIFSSFGLYMSSRADLWPVTDCLELATIPDKAVATPTNLVRTLLSGELNCLLEETFGAFAARPFESRLVFQSHYAQLGGKDVIVKVIHPETESQLLSDFDLLPLLRDSFGACSVSDSAFKSAAADFCHSFRKQMDFVQEAGAFETLAQESEEYDALRAPRVYRSLCSSRVLVVEKPNGLRLDELMSSLNESRGSADRALPGSLGFERDELARLLCEVWLRQALLGRCFPVDPSPEKIMVFPGKQIAFTGGAFTALPTETQANLWNYLLAAATEKSDKACACLLKELRKEDSSASDDVRQRFRQAMPFRDGGWDASGDRESLAELLFVQWRFANEGGYVPLNHLPAFYRGLFSIVDIARRIAPRIDPLAEGVRDLRLLSGLSQFSNIMSQRQFAELTERYSAMMMYLPQNFDEALTSISEGPARLKARAGESADHRRGTSSAGVAALLLVLAAFVLLSHYIATSVVAGVWASRINTIVFMVFGALLLRAVSRLE